MDGKTDKVNYRADLFDRKLLVKYRTQNIIDVQTDKQKFKILLKA